MKHSADVLRQGRKVTQVIEGARTVFLRNGFEGASVDEIAREARVSKATLYSYFADKRLMFMEVARAECRRQADASMEMIDPARGVAETLRVTGRNLIRFMTSDFGQRVFRICVAESDRFPELGQRFYESGPKMVRDAMVSFLKAAEQRGEIACEDVELAADQFAELCKADIFPRILFCRDCKPDDAAIDRVVDGAVETFMARYGTAERAPSAPSERRCAAGEVSHGPA